MSGQSKELRELLGEETFSLTLEEVVTSFGVSRTTIVEIVDQGIIEPQGDLEAHWQFDDEDLGKIRQVLRLNRDFGVNPAGAGLAMELLKEIERLRRRMDE